MRYYLQSVYVRLAELLRSYFRKENELDEVSEDY